MKKSFYSSFLLSSFALIGFSASEPILANNSYSDKQNVSIRIEQSIGNSSALSVQLIGDYIITSTSDKSLKKKVKNQIISLSISKNKLKMNSDAKTYSDLKFTPSKESPENLIKLNDNLSYLGVMDFTIEKATVNNTIKDTIQPKNTLSVGNYLLGVVPHEMPPSWNEEALKAQTVSARTYLHKKMQTDAHKLEDTVKYQVYKGYSKNPKIEQIIKDTSNEVLLYNNRLAETFYSSSNGGFVNSTKDYGWNSLPYSVSKCDPFDPKRYFESTIDEKTLIDKVLKNTSVKEITKITYSSVGANGRPSIVYFETDKGSFNVSINDFRNRLNYDTLKNTLITSSSYNGEILSIEGYGWGHGVGMSQFGAQEMAKQNLSYKDILGFYYEGVSLNGKKLSYKPKNSSSCTKPTIKTANSIPVSKPTISTPNTQTKPKENTSSTTTNTTKIYTVNTNKNSTLSLRQSASTSSKILSQLKSGVTVKLLKDFDKKWFYVEYGGKKGYVSKDYIKVTSKNTTNSTTSNTKQPSTTNQTTSTTKIYTVNTKSSSLTLRQSASTSSKALIQIPKGKTVKLIKDLKNNWYQVEYSGKKGYVSKDYIKVTTVNTTSSNSQKTPNTSSSNDSSNSHTVKKGDTLYNISKKYNISVDKLISLNKLKNSNISIGQKLKLK